MYKKIQQLGFWLINTLVLFTLTASTLFANNQTPKKPTIPEIETLPGPAQGQSVTEASAYISQTFLPRITLTVVSVAVAAAVVFLIYGAIQFLTAYGNEEKLGNAKKTLYFALIGLVISLLSYAIVQVLFYTAYWVS